MSATVGIIRCQVGDEAYCFEMSSVSSVYQASALRCRPALNLGDPVGEMRVSENETVPVFRWQDCLRPSDGSAPAGLIDQSRGAHVVVFNSSLGRQGLVVDAVSRVLSVPADALLPIPPLLNDPIRRLLKSIVLFREHGKPTSLSFLLSTERLHHNALPLASEKTPPGAPDWLPNSAVSIAESSQTRATERGDRREELSGGASGARGVNPAKLGRLVLFPLASRRVAGREVYCALSATQIVEVLPVPQIIPVSTAPAHVSGCVLWRDQAVPVLRLEECLGLTMELPVARLIVARHAGELVALPTSGMLRGRRLPLPHQPCSPPDEMNSSAILGTFQADSEFLVIPNLARLSRPQPNRVLTAMVSS